MVIMALRGCAQSFAKTALTARRNLTTGLKSKSCGCAFRFASLTSCQGRRMASSISSVTYCEFSFACINVLSLSTCYNCKYKSGYGVERSYLVTVL